LHAKCPNFGFIRARPQLQAALGDLIRDGIVENTHAKRLRTVNVVNYRKNEMLRRLK